MLEITESVALADVAGTMSVIKHLDRLGWPSSSTTSGPGTPRSAY